MKQTFKSAEAAYKFGGAYSVVEWAKTSGKWHVAGDYLEHVVRALLGECLAKEELLNRAKRAA